jgi:hypothetical protein
VSWPIQLGVQWLKAFIQFRACFFMIHVNSILPSKPMSLKFQISRQKFCIISHLEPNNIWRLQV